MRVWLTSMGKWRGLTCFAPWTSALRVAVLDVCEVCPAIEEGLSLVVSMAGGRAEELITPRAVYAGPDRKSMMQTLRDVWGCETPEERAEIGRPLATISAGLVGLCRPQIEALAEVLMINGSVGQRDIRRILAPRIIPPAWVVAVVAAVLDVKCDDVVEAERQRFAMAYPSCSQSGKAGVLLEVVEDTRRPQTGGDWFQCYPR